MALHKDFPQNPFEILDPSVRWFPAPEDLREQGYEKLMPPFVSELRKLVKDWRDKNYEGATETSKSLLNWWFKEQHNILDNNGIVVPFRYYFSQREAVETIIWLYDVAKVSNKYDLLRFDTLGRVSPNMFPEDWLRFVVKMATGSGKTKVMSLVLAWAYFHKLYELESKLAKNFLLITPNIIVLERIKTDFEGLKIFYNDPVLPDNGYDGQNWQDDFQVKLHLQDEIGPISQTGNIFLTNIHRVFESEIREPGVEDEDTMEYFLGDKPVTKTNQSRVDLGGIVRDIDELIVINDEAHHIHDEKLAWFKSIQDIHNQLKLKGGELALQIDVTATPKHHSGNIFVQIVSDYPLVEAIHQRVVKKPIVPDQASRGKLVETQSSIFSEKYREYLNLGVEEWRKTYKELEKAGKKSILFVMTDDTQNCDDVAEYLEKNFPEFRDAVLTIHTNKSGEISESVSGKDEKELIKLRQQANDIDGWDSPHKAIVSVLMLKEGWDVKNVTTIIGLRAYSSKSNILPEQTLGRGLRRMFFGRDDIEEYVSVIGTPAFMDFIESIKGEGIILEKREMSFGSRPVSPMVIEIDNQNDKKDIKKLDIELPVLTPRIQREYKNLNALDVLSFHNSKLRVREFTEQEKKEIVFKDVVSELEHHKLILDANISPDYQRVVGFFVQSVMRDLRLFGCYDILFGKMKEFIGQQLFDKEVELNDSNVLRNLSEAGATKIIRETFKKEINDLTVQDKGDTEIKNYISVGQSRPFVVKDKNYLIPKKSIFNKIIGDSDFELQFASFLEQSDDLISYAKNYGNVSGNFQFKIDYKNTEGGVSFYYPDFIIKKDDKNVYIVETKGREDLNDLKKIERLKQWCEDVNSRQNKFQYNMLYVKQEEWEKYKVKNFEELIKLFNSK